MLRAKITAQEKVTPCISDPSCISDIKVTNKLIFCFRLKVVRGFDYDQIFELSGIDRLRKNQGF